MGDPAGIGPEIIIKALQIIHREDARWSEVLEVHGDPFVLRRAEQAIIGDSAEPSILSRIPCICTFPGGPIIEPGQMSASSGEAAYVALVSALRGISEGRLAGLVTAPISKAALNLAGHNYPGHTEILAEAAGGVPVRMMLTNGELSVVLVTIHLPLRRALDAISIERIAETVRITERHFKRLGKAKPTLAVAGLNPHAGEEGLLGSEEIELIAPAIQQCKAEGIDVSGPYSPDTIFMRARASGEFDAVIAQYHDQGLIPVKYLGVENGVNVTLGLPFIRTSPDHGTAFDIAGKYVADPSSMIAAIRHAEALARQGELHG